MAREKGRENYRKRARESHLSSMRLQPSIQEGKSTDKGDQQDTQEAEDKVRQQVVRDSQGIRGTWDESYRGCIRGFSWKIQTEIMTKILTPPIDFPDDWSEDENLKTGDWKNIKNKK